MLSSGCVKQRSGGTSIQNSRSRNCVRQPCGGPAWKHRELCLPLKTLPHSRSRRRRLKDCSLTWFSSREHGSTFQYVEGNATRKEVTPVPSGLRTERPRAPCYEAVAGGAVPREKGSTDAEAARPLGRRRGCGRENSPLNGKKVGWGAGHVDLGPSVFPALRFGVKIVTHLMCG